uniref:MLO-like protein n=1 Tax=Rhizophora mucronata TaxID=61149 RepID=A0A2P2JVS4_RHIMU
MDEGEASLALTPTWAVATVITVLISLGYFLHCSLKRFGKWLDKTKRKALLSALDKIKEELMLFGLLSLLMGHWIVFVAKICVKRSGLSRRFYPCAVKEELRSTQEVLVSTYKNVSMARDLAYIRQRDYCPEGYESFASSESLEQLHRLMFVLVIIHTSYSFIAIALGMIKVKENTEFQQYIFAFEAVSSPRKL